MVEPPKRINLLANKQRNYADKIYTRAAPTVQVSKPKFAAKTEIQSLHTPKPSKSPTFGSKTGSLHKSPTPLSSRQSSREPRDPIRQVKAQSAKRASPVATTPQWASDEDDESVSRKKRARRSSVDVHRHLRDVRSFSETDGTRLQMVHAADIANDKTQVHGRYQYSEYFSALQGEEEECPTIRLQYPSASQHERYQLVDPTLDCSDFKPLSEIQDNMKMVANFYLDNDSAREVTAPDVGSGLVEKLQRAARNGAKGVPGAQTEFVTIVKKYNSLVSRKRKDGTIARKLDEMDFVPLPLVQHIVKDQIYARTVSPKVDMVREYKGFSDNVYGELLPKFLSQIFQETRLKSNQIFVDLGSGVGNCVLQAALEVGCESWGCEQMPNPATLAEAQAKEFPARCQLWGIKPGKIRLLQDDFTTNTDILNVLKKADVVLVNNQAFNPPLNEKLKYIFLDLKEGCQVVSLKYFRDPLHKVKETNINDPVNFLHVVEKERFSGMVSWTDESGKWYIQTKDSSEVRRVQRRIDATSKGSLDSR